MDRRITRVLRLGKVEIGGNSAISIQSMTNSKTEDVAATVLQINQQLAETFLIEAPARSCGL